VDDVRLQLKRENWSLLRSSNNWRRVANWSSLLLRRRRRISELNRKVFHTRRNWLLDCVYCEEIYEFTVVVFFTLYMLQ